MLRWLFSAVTTVLVLYALAGRWDLPWLWATATAGSLLTLALTLTIDPDLARERRHPGPGARDGATRVVMVAAMAVQMVIACLDVGRFRWLDRVPEALRAAALASFTAGFALVTWSVAVNRFFSSVIRIQPGLACGLIVLRRAADGSWRLCADHHLFHGLTVFGHAEVEVIAEDQPPHSSS